MDPSIWCAAASGSTTPRDFWTFNGIYASYFGAAPPARTCVQSAMMIDCKVEIDCVAYKPAES